MAFAKLKALLRAAAARTIPDLWQAITDALRRFTPKNAPTISPPQDTMQPERKILWKTAAIVAAETVWIKSVSYFRARPRSLPCSLCRHCLFHVYGTGMESPVISEH